MAQMVNNSGIYGHLKYPHQSPPLLMPLNIGRLLIHMFVLHCGELRIIVNVSNKKDQYSIINSSMCKILTIHI